MLDSLGKYAYGDVDTYDITATDATCGTFHPGNYDMSKVVEKLSVSHASLTVTGVVADNKVYDAGLGATLDLSNAQLQIGLNSGSVSVKGTGGTIVIKNGRSASPQRTSKKSLTSSSHGDRTKTMTNHTKAS